MKVLPQLRKSGGDIIASHKSTNVPKTFTKEAELCFTGDESKWLNVTFVSKRFKHGPEALSCSPGHGLGKPPLPAHRSHSWWSFSLLCSQEAHLWVSQTNHPGTERSRGLEAPELQISHINLPICSKMAHVRNVAHSYVSHFSFPQGSDNNTCLPPNSLLKENRLIYTIFTNTFQ